MNKKDLKQALSILKSQKLIKRFDIEIKKDFDLKEYIVFLEKYNSKYSNIIHFNSRSQLKTSDIKYIIYENYIKQ